MNSEINSYGAVHTYFTSLNVTYVNIGQSFDVFSVRRPKKNWDIGPNVIEIFQTVASREIDTHGGSRSIH